MMAFFFFLLVLPLASGLVSLPRPSSLVELVNGEPEFVRAVMMEWSSAGAKMKKANKVSGGSAQLLEASIEDVSDDGLTLKTKVSKRPYFGKPKVEDDLETIAWPEKKERGAGDSQKEEEEALLQRRVVEVACALGLAKEAAMLSEGMFAPVRENLWLNNIPASRPTRGYLYDSIADATVDAVRKRKEGAANRLAIYVKPPELDDELDTYRVGTLLEMTRVLALAVVRDLGLRVRICVQAPMGTGSFQGLPLSLNGVRRILEGGMDWGESQKELFEEKFVRFGAVSKNEEDVDDMDDVFVVLAPQSTVGCPIVPSLKDMAEAAGDRPLIVVNPKLKDVQSSQDVMSVRGRAGRMAVADSFDEFFRFATVVQPGRTFHPILGLVVKHRIGLPYVVYERKTEQRGIGGGAIMETSSDKARAVQEGDLVETYRPIALFPKRPSDGTVLAALDGRPLQTPVKRRP